MNKDADDLMRRIDRPSNQLFDTAGSPDPELQTKRRMKREALRDLLNECNVAIQALERASAWPFASRLKDKLRLYKEVAKD